MREDSAEWESCNMKVNSDFSGDWMKEFDGLIPPMLEDGVEVLIYGADSVRCLCWLFRLFSCFFLGREASPSVLFVVFVVFGF